MRVLAIRGQDLTSLAGGFEVDFEAEPLASAGIFAITGPTGAGKSTLLDAICLALFNHVPRLAASGSGQVGAAGGEMLSITDPRALLRHRAAAGFAEVDFIGVDRSRYRARWSVRRAHGRVDGALQQVVQELTNLETGERFGGTRTETLEAIRAKVGLSADEFGRAVLLAQGGFNAFIDANPSTRAELLEKLTGTGIYARLGVAAKHKADEVRLGLSGIEAQIAGQNGLDDIARGEAEVRLGEARTLHDTARTRLAGLERAREWYAAASALALRVRSAEDDLGAARARQTEAAFRRTELRRRKLAYSAVPMWRAAQDATAKAGHASALLAELVEAAGDADLHTNAMVSRERDAVAALDEANREREAQRPALEAARSLDRQLAALGEVVTPLLATAATTRAEAERTATVHAEAVAAREASSGERNAVAVWLDGHVAHGRIAARRDDVAADLAEYEAEAGKALTLTGESAVIADQLAEARADHDAVQAGEEAARQGLAVASAERDAARAGLPASGALAELDAERDGLIALESRLLEFERFDADLTRIGVSIEAAEQEAERVDSLLSSNKAREDEIVALLPGMMARRDEAQRAGALSAAASEEAAARLRAALVPGEPCPVCGGKDHAVEALAELIDGRATADQERIRSLSGEIAELEQERAVLRDREAQHSARRVEAVERKRDADRTQSEARTLRDQSLAVLVEALSRCAIPMDDDRDALRASISGRLTIVGASRRLVATAQERERTSQEAFEAAGILLAQKVDDQRAVAAALQELERENEAIADRLAEALRRRDHVAARLDASLSPIFDWRHDRAAIDTLDRFVSAWGTQERELSRIDAEMPMLVQAVHKADVVRQQKASEAQASTRAAAERQAEYTQLAESRSALLAGEDVGTVHQRLDDAVQSASDARDDARSSADSARAESTAAQGRCEQARVALNRDQADAATRREALQAELASKAIDEELVAAVAAEGENALAQEEATLAGIDQAVVLADAEHKSRERDHAAHLATQAPALLEGELTEAFVEAGQEEAAARSVLGEAELVIRQDDSARAATAALRAVLEQARASAQVWLQLDTLIGDATGNKFRRFAQGLTLEHLLRHANARLAELKPRYSLERAQGGDMLVQVIDHDMAGEVRGLSNLSGGERFLVSLALALGLSEMSTGQGMRVESLFIDEGFGALDSASLGQAIGMLEQLHATGRRVGVISHIEEVKERIAVKIAVTPATKGSSSIEVLES